MKAFVTIVLLVGAVAADIGIGYQYKVPHTSYGVPYNQHPSAGVNQLSSNNQYAGNSQYASGNQYASGQQYAGTSNLASAVSQASQESNNLGQNSFLNYQGQANNAGYQGLQADRGQVGYQQQGAFGSAGAQQGYQNSGNYQGLQNFASSGSKGSYQQQQPSYQYQTAHKYEHANQYQYQQYYNQIQQQPAQVFKHFYVHAAPEEPEVPRYRQPPVLPAPQKHYKIIFIKTPTQAAPAPQYIPLQQQNEEKTIVYVLVKKPEEGADIVLPKVEQKKPTKPEVYFIKYNSKEGSQGVINNIVADYSKEQGVVGGATDASAFGQQGLTSQGISNIFGSEQALTANNEAVSAATSEGSTSGAFAYGGGNAGHGQAISLSSAQAGNLSGGSALTQNQFSGGDVDSFIGSSQGLPHETYGPPKFSGQ